MSIQWIVFFCAIGTLLLASCEQPCNEKVKERCNKACDRVGTCQIENTYNTAGQFSKSKRVCRWIKKPDIEQCGKCTDVKRDEKGLVLSKTCIVCNLCENDFACLANDECEGAKKICDRGLCVGCLEDTQCKASSRPLCVEGECIGCKVDKDCKTKALPSCYKQECTACRCATTSPKKPQCLKKSDGSILCVECTEKSHCPSERPVCDTKRNVCIAECTTEKDCKDGLKCFNGTCSECGSREDCKDPQTPVCSKGKCVCEGNGDCSPSFPICSSLKKRCVECKGHGDCDKSFPICNTLGQCEQQQCDPSKPTCSVSGQVCRKLGRRFVCAQCIENQDCKDGKSCDLSCFCCK